jgi:hypothetical protein
MPTATPFTEPGSVRLSDGSELALGPEEPLVYQASGRDARRTIGRQTDERGRPLSIFAARRQRGKVEHRDARQRADELEAAVRSWSAWRS